MLFLHRESLDPGAKSNRFTPNDLIGDREFSDLAGNPGSIGVRNEHNERRISSIVGRFRGNLWHVARSASARNKIAGLRAGQASWRRCNFMRPVPCTTTRFLHNSALPARQTIPCPKPLVLLATCTTRTCILPLSVYDPLKYRHECPAGRVSGSQPLVDSEFQG